MLSSGREASLRLGQGGLSACHGAIGLVLVGAGQIASLRTPGHVGGDEAGVVQLIAGSSDLDTRTLPLPPGVADGGGHAQLRRDSPALDGGPFGVGQRRAAATLSRQPQRHSDTDLDFARSVVVAHAVGLV